jgi:hypothetical protein
MWDVAKEQKANSARRRVDRKEDVNVLSLMQRASDWSMRVKKIGCTYYEV